MSEIAIYEMEGRRLFSLFPDLYCEACKKNLADALDETWVKAGCGYFCADCVAKGVHLTHPMACRIG